MEITAKQVNELRQKTGVSMMACKKALVEAGGDQEKAVDILRKKGEAKAVEKSERAAKEGCIQITLDDGKAAVSSIYCETDFVARNEGFIKVASDIAGKLHTEGEEAAKIHAEDALKELFNQLGENLSLGQLKTFEGENIGAYVHSNNKLAAVVVLDGGDQEMATDIAMHITAMNPHVIDPSEVSEELITKEKEIWIDQLKQEGKPENIIENILKGKEKKFREEAALLKQTFVKDPEKTIEQLIGDVKIVEFVRFEV